MLLATYVVDRREPGDTESRSTVSAALNEDRRTIMRYAFLFQALLYKQAAGSSDLRDLVDVDLATEEEHDILTRACYTGKYFIVCSWMSEMLLTLADAGCVAQRLTALPLLQQNVSNMRALAADALMYIAAQ